MLIWKSGHQISPETKKFISLSILAICLITSAVKFILESFLGILALSDFVPSPTELSKLHPTSNNSYYNWLYVSFSDF